MTDAHALLVFVVTSRHHRHRNTATIADRIAHRGVPIVSNHQFDLLFRKTFALQKLGAIVEQSRVITGKRSRVSPATLRHVRRRKQRDAARGCSRSNKKRRIARGGKSGAKSLTLNSRVSSRDARKLPRLDRNKRVQFGVAETPRNRAVS